MIRFDYAEVERLEEKEVIRIGLTFEDEPNELYLAEAECALDGGIRSLRLFFNGMDCRYAWKAEERERLLGYLNLELNRGQALHWVMQDGQQQRD